MSKIYWTDATGKKWSIEDMSESHINNILNKLSMQDIMKCVAYMQMAGNKKKAKRKNDLFDHMPEGMQEEYINSMYDDLEDELGFNPDNPWEGREL